MWIKFEGTYLSETEKAYLFPLVRRADGKQCSVAIVHAARRRRRTAASVPVTVAYDDHGLSEGVAMRQILVEVEAVDITGRKPEGTLERVIQYRADEGWTLRAMTTIAGAPDTIIAYLVFAKKVHKEVLK